MENENAESIMRKMEDLATKKIPMSPHYYVECAQQLVSLMGNETDALHKFQREVAELRVSFLDEHKSVAEAKLRTECSEIYETMLRQKSKCERINEIIRIAKIQARMRDNEFGAGNL